MDELEPDRRDAARFPPIRNSYSAFGLPRILDERPPAA
jgi:hypothetical protein